MRAIMIISAFLFSGLTVQAQNWQLNFEESKTLATDNNQFIIMVFKGSDWCAPCMKLEHEILDTDEFMNYAKENAVLLEVDFPRRRKNKLSDEQQDHNNLLFEKYNKSGAFPFVAILDKDGNALGSLGYDKVAPSKFITQIENITK